MRSARGTWYGGKTSRGHAATISCDGDVLRVAGDGVEAAAPLREVKIDPRLGETPRMLRFPCGGMAETTDHPFLYGLQRRQGSGGFFRAVHRWESSLGWAFLALLLTLLVGFGFLRYAVPHLATRLAYALPPQTESYLGKETLQILDRMVLKPSQLPEERRGELTRLFAEVAGGNPARQGWRLEYRSGERIGANAFALPSGIVVISDKLVELAKSDDEIAGVLAHEIGHVTRRHALRHVMQNSATALLVATVTGDLTSISSLSATMPTLLVDAKYSRDFEREADDAAVAWLKGKGIPVKSYADILGRLGAQHGEEEKGARFGELFNDHPQIPERVKRVLAE